LSRSTNAHNLLSGLILRLAMGMKALSPANHHEKDEASYDVSARVAGIGQAEH
jgi:hypothetical protein